MSAQPKATSYKVGKNTLSIAELKNELQKILGTDKCTVDLIDYTDDHSVTSWRLMITVPNLGPATLLPRIGSDGVSVHCSDNKVTKHLGITFKSSKTGSGKLLITDGKGKTRHAFNVRPVHYTEKGLFAHNPWTLVAVAARIH